MSFPEAKKIRKCLKYLQRIVFISSNLRCGSMTLIFVSYLLFGGIIFAWIEKKWTFENPLDKRLTSSDLMRDMVTLLRSHNFDDLQIKASFARQHYEKVHDKSLFHVSWIYAYSQKTMFALVLIATLGYGNVVPTTEWGRAFTVLYLVIGRPIHLIMIRLIGVEYRSCLRKLLKGSRNLTKILPELLHTSKITSTWTGFWFFAFFTVVFILGPAAIFGRYEGWSYMEGVYFCLLSLSTIGLGDYIAGLSERNYSNWLYTVYVLVQFVWLVFGISYMNMCYVLLSYLFGLFVLDKLDCKCVKRQSARDDISNLYNFVADLNWKLAKHCPEKFTEQTVFQEFLDLCVDHPEDINKEIMEKLYDTAEKLRVEASNCLQQLKLPEEVLEPMKSLIDDSKEGQIMASDSFIARELKESAERRQSARLTITPHDKFLPPLDMLSPDNNTPKNLPDIESASPSASSRSTIELLLEKGEKDSEESEKNKSGEVEEERKEDHSDDKVSSD
ncbi:uncharacterized protein [Parasteatoda tepidariorum]|uniref:uncharacterized protein n=1 Tax=Parasteatoda tepidariorum TaxID=114398 RepID=UPI00077FC62F|nr:uncharacterized protein LOC107452767 [Parasteatoda tepidariorum]